MELKDSAALSSLSPVSPNCTAEFNEGTCEYDPDFMKTICNNNTICGRSLSQQEILIVILYFKIVILILFLLFEQKRRICCALTKINLAAHHWLSRVIVKRVLNSCRTVVKLLATLNAAQIITSIAVYGPQRDIAFSSQEKCSSTVSVLVKIVNFVKIEIMIVQAWQKMANAQKIQNI